MLTAIKQAARDLSTRLPQGARISILNTSANEVQLGEYIIEQIITEIVKGKELTVVDRRNLQFIRAEQAFQLSGDVSDESAISIGHMIGAEIVVTCSITGSSSLRRLFIKALNVETNAIVYQNSLEI
jgi:curli biogenesis system outer membrane secretion channel CsgG